MSHKTLSKCVWGEGAGSMIHLCQRWPQTSVVLQPQNRSRRE